MPFYDTAFRISDNFLSHLQTDQTQNQPLLDPKYPSIKPLHRDWGFCLDFAEDLFQVLTLEPIVNSAGKAERVFILPEQRLQVLSIHKIFPQKCTYFDLSSTKGLMCQCKRQILTKVVRDSRRCLVTSLGRSVEGELEMQTYRLFFWPRPLPLKLNVCPNLNDNGSQLARSWRDNSPPGEERYVLLLPVQKTSSPIATRFLPRR